MVLTPRANRSHRMPSPRLPDHPLTPLVIRFGRMGDMLLQAPLLHLLHRRYGNPCRLLSAGTWSGALFADHPDVGEIWQLRGRHTPLWLSPERWKVIKKIGQHDGPIYVSEDTRRSLRKINPLLRFSGIARDRCVFINDFHAGIQEHWVDELLRFGRQTPTAFAAADYPWHDDDIQTAPQLFLTAQDRADCAAWIEQRNFGSAPLVLLQPGNWKAKKWGRKREADPKAWPIDRWTALLRAMHQRLPAARLVLCGSPVEAVFLETLQRSSQLACVEVAANDLPIRRLLALLERAHSMVSIDTGPAHLAAAAGCPLIVMYGSYSPLRWDRRSPFGKPIINLGGPPQCATVADISLQSVVAAWQSLV